MKAISFQEYEGSGYGEQVGYEIASLHRACYKQNIVVLEGNGQRPSHRGNGYEESEVSYTLNSTEQHAVAYRKTAHPRNAEEGQGYEQTDTADTLNVNDVSEARTPMLVFENHQQDGRIKPMGDINETVTQKYGTGGNNVPYVVGADPSGVTLGRARASYNQGKNAQFDFSIEEEKIGAQTAKGPGAVCTTIVRRLTPKECERLQGFPDDWTNIGEWTDSKGKKHKDADSPRYKALGNSIALPFWQWLVKRISAQYERTPTMGSLFDGIGGFPLCWMRTNGSGSVLWASEIEEFCIAVTKKHFGDEDAGTQGDWKEYI